MVKANRLEGKFQGTMFLPLKLEIGRAGSRHAMEERQGVLLRTRRRKITGADSPHVEVRRRFWREAHRRTTGKEGTIGSTRFNCGPKG